ncbi:unnamed protein product [Allacma fusca]|uniref:Uncharacterized protein n=1 Tax=Allacma fusca TaxID=39272 RepID=A0A8J2KPI8_9HEXA|nr:unnamed protein product [Allacma fusca]
MNMGSLVARFPIFAKNMPERVSPNNYDDSIGLQESRQEIVLDFNKFMRENVENIRDIQQQSLARQIETNDNVRAQGLQINRLRHQVQERTQMLKETIVEVSGVSQRQVEELRLEVNHFREQFNLRMERLEVDLEVSRARENQRAVQAMDLAQDQTHVNGKIVHTLSELVTGLTANVRHPQMIETTPGTNNSLHVNTNSNPEPEMDFQDETPVISDVTGQSRSGRIIKKRELFSAGPLPSPKCSGKKSLSLKCRHCGRILKTITGMQKHVEKFCPALK